MPERKSKKRSAKAKAAPEPEDLPLPTLDEALMWVGEPVDDSSGQRLGKVSGIFADAETDEPKWLVLKMGRLAGEAAVPFEHTAEGGGRVWVAYERETVRNSPRLKAGQKLNAGQELQLCEHYGIRVGIGRAAEVAEREGGEVTAVPAA
jgi:PRC-barrel domain protein